MGIKAHLTSTERKRGTQIGVACGTSAGYQPIAVAPGQTHPRNVMGDDVERYRPSRKFDDLCVTQVKVVPIVGNLTTVPEAANDRHCFHKTLGTGT